MIQVHGKRWGCPDPQPDVETGRNVRPKHRCNGPWRLTIDLGMSSGKRKRLTVERSTKYAVLAERDRLIAERGSGIEPDRITVGEWLDTWIKAAELKPYTLRGYEGYIRNWLKPHLGDVRLQKLSSTHIRAMVAAMTEAGKSPATIRQCKAILGRALTVAERDRLVTRNVAKHVETPKVRSTPHAILAPEQATAVINAASDAQQQARLVLALMVGLRQGEALGLRWGDVTLCAPDAEHQAGVIVVSRSVAFVKGEVVEQTTKSSNSDRTIHIGAAATTALRRWRGEQWDEAAWVFPGSGEDPLAPWVDFDNWQDACRRAGVPVVPLHGARGTLETTLILAGVPVTDSAAMLGHDQVTALRHYARVTAASQQALAGRVDELFSGATSVEPAPLGELPPGA